MKIIVLFFSLWVLVFNSLTAMRKINENTSLVGAMNKVFLKFNIQIISVSDIDTVYNLWKDVFNNSQIAHCKLKKRQLLIKFFEDGKTNLSGVNNSNELLDKLQQKMQLFLVNYYMQQKKKKKLYQQLEQEPIIKQPCHNCDYKPDSMIGHLYINNNNFKLEV